ncbi:MAG: amidase [Alphaproteobacteria bacterium]|nr:amidase [Alphaproteobacteria bacterium]
MNRISALAFFGLLASLLGACGSETQSAPGDESAAGKPQASAVDAVPAAPATSAEALIAALEVGNLTSESAVAAYLERIEAIDRQGPTLGSIIVLNPDAIEEARARDAERAAGELRGPLHGVPVLVKDNVETRELPTTAGSLALAANDTMRDAPVVARLRAEGAIILGKTNLSEWANFRSFDSISGWSGVGGQARNPHHTDRTPCGSSSGSGAAVAALLAPLAIGTETNGSITCPAAMNGIVGFKPTVGLLSRSGIVPIAASQDTAGPMTRTVRDAALMLNAMAGSDPADPATSEADARKADYLARIEAGVDGMRIGVFRWAEGDDPRISAAFEAALAALQSEGAVLVDIADFEPDPILEASGLDLLLMEFRDGVNRYLETTAPAVEARTLSDLIAFNDANADREMPLFDQSIFVAAAEAPDLDDPEYIRIRDGIKQAAGRDGIDKLLAAHDVELLVMPSRRPAEPIMPTQEADDAPNAEEGADDEAETDETKEDGPARVGAGWLGAMAGYPIITVPMGDADGLPLGLTFIGTAWDDEKVLVAGRAYERASNMIRMPTFRED